MGAAVALVAGAAAWFWARPAPIPGASTAHQQASIPDPAAP
jgi:hypothetical protein